MLDFLKKSTSTLASNMDRLITNPGLSHLGIEIFKYLDIPSLLKARLVCQLWNEFIETELLCQTKINYWKHQASWKTDSFFYLWPEWIEIFDKIHSMKYLKIFCELFENYFTTSSDWNMSPLHFAASRGNAEFTELAIELIGPIIEEKGHQSIDYGLNPLHLAVESGNLKLVKLLAETYNCVDQENFRQMKPLHFAASSGFPEIFRYLHEKAEDKNPKDCYGQTTLHLAALQDNSEFLEFLIGIHFYNVDVTDNDGNTPLHYATGNFKIFEIVYKYAQDKQPRNHKGQSPLEWKSAPDYSDPKVIKFLRKKYKCKKSFSFKNFFRFKKSGQRRPPDFFEVQKSHNLFDETLPSDKQPRFMTHPFTYFEPRSTE